MIQQCLALLSLLAIVAFGRAEMLLVRRRLAIVVGAIAVLWILRLAL